MCFAQRGSQRALLLVSVSVILAGVVADAGRPPHVRDRVSVARVVSRVRPLLAEVDEVREQRLVEREQRLLGHEVRDVDRDRERHVVPAAVAAQLRVGLVGVREEVVGDLDAVLLLERRDDVLADVLGPVVDEELVLGFGHRRRLGRRGRRPGSRRRTAAAEAAAARGRRWTSPAPPVVQAAMIGARAATGPSLAIASSSWRRLTLSLDHVAGQLLLEVEARAVVRVTHRSGLLLGTDRPTAEDERVRGGPGDGDVAAGRESDPRLRRQDGHGETRPT